MHLSRTPTPIQLSNYNVCIYAIYPFAKSNNIVVTKYTTYSMNKIFIAEKKWNDARARFVKCILSTRALIIAKC